MRILKWEPNFSPTRESPVAPVCVRFEGIPLYMFEEKLSISNSIGKPIRVNPLNVNRRVLNSAKFCVELDVSKPLIHSICVCFEDDESNDVLEGFWVQVYYDVLPSYCASCSHLGHSLEVCKFNAKVETTFTGKRVDAADCVDPVFDKRSEPVLTKNSMLFHFSSSSHSPRRKGQSTQGGDEVVTLVDSKQHTIELLRQNVMSEDLNSEAALVQVVNDDLLSGVQLVEHIGVVQNGLQVGVSSETSEGHHLLQSNVTDPIGDQLGQQIEIIGGQKTRTVVSKIGTNSGRERLEQTKQIERHEEATLEPVLQLDEVMCSTGSEQQSHRLVADTSLEMCKESKELALVLDNNSSEMERSLEKQLVDGFTTPEKKADAPTTTTYATTTRTPSSWTESVEKEEQAKTISQLDVLKVSEYAKKKIEQIMQEPLYPGRTGGDKTNPRKAAVDDSQLGKQSNK
ncbi:hypothetical protein LIER_19696 [Lithospermum erythrorhizon]|uniref:DUF4283 domain-containing protein n=1 Tax=Lithospermum erythrorhizon TaxID=34254 RepID=A0AAV3QP87_LITER